MQHYLHHNEYGLRFASSLKVPEGQIVLSTSTFTGTGVVGGSHAHAQTQVNCSWGNMETALRVVLGLGLSGVPLAGGGPVCGNVGDYDENLCLR
jgi:Alpha-glucosidases, family 31 of glycosyl hydrolases